MSILVEDLVAIPNVRLAVRGLVKTPGFTVTVVLTLALARLDARGG